MTKNFLSIQKRSGFVAALFFLIVAAFSTLPARAVTIEEVVTPSGIKAWLVQDRTLPIISLSAAFRGGSGLDPDGKAGTGSMVSLLLDEGAGPYDSLTFQKMLEDRAINLSFDVGKDMFSLSLKTLSENRDEAFTLLGLALSEPRFAQPEIERIRSQILAGMQRDEQDPDLVSARAWLAHVYAGHPYGRPAKGDAASVATLTADDLKRYAKNAFTRDRLLVAVVGDVDAEEVVPLLEQAFGKLAERKSDRDREISTAPKTYFDGSTTVIERDNPQSVATFGGPGLLRSDPDWYPAMTLNYILGGGGFSSRLTEEVRAKRGLSYSVDTYLQPFMASGAIIGSVASRNDGIMTALDVIRAEWKRMGDEGPSAEELENAKTYLIGSFPLSMSSTSAMASILLSGQVYDLGIDFLDRRSERLERITLDDMKRVSRRLFDPESLTTLIVGKPQAAAEK